MAAWRYTEATIAPIQVSRHHRMPVIRRRPTNNHQVPVVTAHPVIPQDPDVSVPPGCHYIFRIRGRLGATALYAFPTMDSQVRGGDTVLTGQLEDRSARPIAHPMLEVEVVARESAVICLPKGTLDATTATTFRGAIALCVGEPELIIDLSDVLFIDGAGLTELVGSIRRAQDRRTRVAVVIPPGTIQTVLDEAGLDRIVSVLETVDLAFAKIDDDASNPERVRSPAQSKTFLPSAGNMGR